MTLIDAKMSAWHGFNLEMRKRGYTEVLYGDFTDVWDRAVDELGARARAKLRAEMDGKAAARREMRTALGLEEE